MFLSYCQKDKGIADIIDTKLPQIERKIEITRDIRAVGDSMSEKSTPQDFLIMCGDIIVARINFDTGRYDVLNEQLLPWSLKGKFRKVMDFSEVRSRYDDTQRQIAIGKNKQAVISWLASRTLSLSRKNAKWLYNLLRIAQLSTDTEKAKVAIMCGAVSLLDNYWIKLEADPITWKEVNLRHNHLNEVIAQVALHGSSLTLQGSLCTPELTTNGAYAKAWRRYPDSSLWLHKAGSKDASESRIEVMCSQLLDKMNVSHCYYTMTEDQDLTVCTCPAMTSDNRSIVDFLSIYSYCCANDLDYNKFIFSIDAESLYKMTIVDYLISNRDRHGQNGGFYYNPHTMKLERCHPLFDHNNAFDTEYMKDRDAFYVFNGKGLRESAKEAMQRVDFHFEQPILRSDFITERQYNEFMWRANDLGVKTIIRSEWTEYCNEHGIDVADSDAEFKRLHDEFKLHDSSVFYEIISSNVENYLMKKAGNAFSNIPKDSIETCNTISDCDDVLQKLELW